MRSLSARVAAPPRCSHRAESTSGDRTPRTRTAARMTDESDEEGEEEEEEVEVELLSLLLLSFSCHKTSTETIAAGETAGGADCRAFQRSPSRSAAFHGSGGVAPGPERR